MKKTKLDRIINFIREEMMTTGFTNANKASGPVAGFDPLLGKKKKRKPTPLGRYRTRVNWKQKGES